METDKLIYNLRHLNRALRTACLSDESAYAVATFVSQRIDKSTITEADLDALDFVESITGRITKDTAYRAATAIINGIDNIKGAYDYLLSIGYSEESVKTFFKKDSSAFSLKRDNLEATYHYLLSIGLNDEEIKEIYLHAISLSPESIKARCALVLKYYDKELLIILSNGFLFYGYYSDPVGAIETAYTTLGRELSRRLLETEEYFLYQFKLDFYQNDFTLPMPHREAVEILEKYKSQLQ